MPTLKVPTDFDTLYRIKEHLGGVDYALAYIPGGDAQHAELIVEPGYPYLEELKSKLRDAGFVVVVTEVAPCPHPNVQGSDTLH